MQWLLKERWRDSPACDKETNGDTCHPTSCCRVIGGASSGKREQGHRETQKNWWRQEQVCLVEEEKECWNGESEERKPRKWKRREKVN